MILLCSQCLRSDLKSLNGSHRVCTEDLTNTIHIRPTVMCCAIVCVCAVVSVCAATLRAEICVFRNLQVADMPIQVYHTEPHHIDTELPMMPCIPRSPWKSICFFFLCFWKLLNILLFRLCSIPFPCLIYCSDIAAIITELVVCIHNIIIQ